MTPEELDKLRSQLPSYASGAPPPLQFDEFCRFYQIDFVTAKPHIEHQAGTIQSGIHTLAVHHWRQPNACANLFIVHGYFDHTGLFGKLVQWGLDAGCNVVIFDLPGHGLSSGEPAVIDDFADYSRAIDDVLQAVNLNELPLWTMAQSTGGAALIDYAENYDWPFAATVLLAPLVRPVGWRGVSFAQRLLGPFKEKVTRTFAINSSDQYFLDFIQRDPLQARYVSLRWLGALRRWLRSMKHQNLGVGPVLIIQGDTDGTVAWRYNIPVLAKLFPGSHVEYVAGAGHQLANETTELRRQYLKRVTGYLSDCGITLTNAQE